MATIPTLCLNMIVKNEAKIITRLLDSVLKIIDCYCICDTGSTDNTIEIIQEYFEQKHISGKIISQPFVHFSHNRNLALKACEGMSDYILLLDADMIVEINYNSFNKNIFLSNSNHFYIFQGTNDFYYKNIRIIKNDNHSYEYIGVTHEYLSVKNDTNTINAINNKNNIIEKNIFFIKDIGDGGSKQNKFLRDIQLLTTGINDEPNNARYHFYLANSYFDIHDYHSAINYYKKRIQLGGWKEEVWYSYYKIGLGYNKLNDFPNALFYWLEGFNYYPERLEGLYEIIKYYRINRSHHLAFEIYKMCERVLNNPLYIQNRNNYLFLHNDVYTYKLYYEYSIIAYYCNITNINSTIIQILNNCRDTSTNNQLLANIKFYNLQLTPKPNSEIALDNSISYGGIEYHSSSSCLLKYLNNYLLNIRYVNYTIQPNGTYYCCKNKNGQINIISINKFVLLDEQFKTTEDNHSFYMPDLINTECNYSGIEDIKIYNFSNKIYFIGTQWHDNTNSLGISYGHYDIENKNMNIIQLKQAFKETTCEKNWVFVNYFNELSIIYNWFPLTICKINNSNFIEIIREIPMPLFFSHIRGSTCAFKLNCINWFILHIVSHELPRRYYHVFAQFDELMNLLTYSAPFKFTAEPIEFCLSLHIDDSTNLVYINYSSWDKTTRINVYDLEYIQSLCCFKFV